MEKAGPLEVRLLGRFAVRRGAEEIPPGAFGGRLVRVLLRVLLTRRGLFVSKDVLAEALWGDHAPADPPANLEILVSRARRALGDSTLIVTSSGGYAFAEDDRCRLDAEEFLSLAAEARDHAASGRASAALRAVREALDRWTGDPLPEDAYEEWAQDHRRELERAYLEVLERGAAAALSVRDPAVATELAERAAALEPLREAAAVLLVHALAAAGDRAAALEAYEAFRTRLVEELGLDPSPQAAQLQASLLRGEPVGSPPGAEVRPPAPEGPRPRDELPFVGRAEELRTLSEVVRRGGVAVVSGPAGSGKSRLLAEAAAGGDVPSIRARAFLPERDEAWSLARSILREALGLDAQAAAAVPERAVAALAQIVPEMDEIRPATAPAVHPSAGWALVLEGALRLLGAAFSSGGQLLLDDVQWADESSLALVGRAVRRVEGLAVIVAFRPEEVAAVSPASSFLQELEAQARRIRLAPLAESALEELVTDPDLAAVIATETDRTPLAVAEVLRLLARERLVERDPAGRCRPRSALAAGVARDAARRGQQAAVAGRVDRLMRSRRDVLELLALLGREAPARLVAAAASRPQAAVLEDLDVLIQAGLARVGEVGWAVSHDLVADVVGSALPTERRLHLHAVLGEALRRDRAEPAEVGRHLAASGDRAGAARRFDRAALEALAAFANDEAVRLAEAGLALDPPAAVRRSLLESRAEGRARRGDLAGARGDLRKVLATRRRGPRRAATLARMAMLSAGSQDYAHGSELVELAIAEAGADQRARAAALTVAAVIDFNNGRAERSDERSAEALAIFEELGDAHGAAVILDARAMAMMLAGDLRAAEPAFDRVARLFSDAGELLRVPTPRSTRGHALVFMARPQDGLADAEEALELARSLGLAEGVCYALWHRAEALGELGRGEDALASAEESVRIAEEIDHREWTAASLRALGIARESLGDHRAAEAAFKRSMEHSDGLPLFGSWAASRLALTLLAHGRIEEAAAALDAAPSGAPGVAGYEHRLARAEVAAATGHPQAQTIAAEALEEAEAGGHLVSAARLRRLT